MSVRPAAGEPRRVLCVFPAYSPSFGSFDSVYGMVGVRAFMPPQGLLLVAAYLPATWQVRFIDENIRRATGRDLRWADAVFVSGMHIQAPQIRDIAKRARDAGCVTVLGGPSVSAAPELYPQFDYLHIGEIGDGTDALIGRLARDPTPPARQMRFETAERAAIEDLPMPAYPLTSLRDYFIASIQFSSGCPFRCEFCDIPALYGRVPRLKTPERVTAELDAILARGRPSAIYFVDDNFIANRKATRALLPHLVDWQRRNGYPVRFACEATLNIAKEPDILAMMREASFHTVFVGIETPEPEALKAIAKDQNARLSILDAVATLNAHGLEVVSGMILGLDSDRRDTAARLIDFIAASNIPMFTVNLLQALPKTPLWDRLAASGRLVDDPARESNVDFLLPYETVLAMWRQVIAAAYRPEAIYRRFAHNAAHTYPNRLKPNRRGDLTPANLRRALRIALNLMLCDGLLADYRREFWRAVGPELAAGRIEEAFNIGLVSHHLIAFTRQALAGRQNASFYSSKQRSDSASAIARTAAP